MLDPKITIYNASAGSGKTFTLVVEYVYLLMDKHIKDNKNGIKKGFSIGNTFNYRYILAVTFTNKATSELKQRLLDLLYELSINSPEVEGERGALKAKDKELSDEIIELSAKYALKNIIHDYSNLYVETIDSFFQRVLKNMTKELGINPRFNLIIDDEDINKEAYNRLVESTRDNPVLYNWFFNKIISKIDEGKRWSLESDMMNLARELNKEAYKIVEDKVLGFGAQESFEKLLKTTEKDLGKYNQLIINNAGNIINLIGNDADDYLKAVIDYYTSLSEGDLDKNIGKTVKEGFESEGSWAKKSSGISLEWIKSNLLPYSTKIAKDLDKRRTLDIILKNLDELSTITEISKHKSDILKEENQFHISDTGNLLAKMIGDEDDISFVFEKIGSQLRYIMIDEFQDTSRLNFNNFKQLINESLANGYSCIIVGDVKQSIYRFNNGDWRILGKIEEELWGKNIEIKNLPTNYRSDKHIVEFNNRLFEGIFHALGPDSHGYLDEFEDISNQNKEEIESVYKSVNQEANKKKDSGLIRYMEVEKDNDRGIRYAALEALKQELEYYQDQGAKPSDIAVLLRTNTEIGLIVNYFYDLKKKGELDTETYSYDVISDDAFHFSFSEDVEMIIAALKHIEDPNDSNSLLRLKLFLLGEDYNEAFENDIKDIEKLREIDERLSFLNNRESLRRMSLNDLIIHLISKLDLNKDSIFLYNFIDEVTEFTTLSKSNLREFIEYWDETLSSKSISIDAKQEGIRLITIHKSKGLEYPICILPFPSWGLASTRHSKVWTRYMGEEEKEEKYISLNIEKGLSGTDYDEAYRTEITNLIIDNLNLLYVAFTRPKKGLSIINEYSVLKSGISYGSRNIAHLLNSTIGHTFRDEINALEERLQEESILRLEIGSLDMGEEKAETSSGYMPNMKKIPLKLSPRTDTEIVFAQTKKAENYFKPSDISHNLERAQIGNMLHEAMSYIRTKDDLDYSVNKIIYSGMASNKEKERLRELLENIIQEKPEWFDGELIVYNEKSIIEKSNITHRPDRVMMDKNNSKDGSVIIVDYKFTPIAQEEYKRQMQRYLNLYKSMGYKDITTYLWYIDIENNEHRIEEVG